MSAFSSSEVLNATMIELWEAIRNDPDMSGKIITSKLVARFHYREPEALITVDCSDGQSLQIYSGDCPIKPVVEMIMSADVAHEFWIGKVSIPVAILTGKIVAKGPVNKALALLPVVKPAFALYPNIYGKRSRKAAVS